MPLPLRLVVYGLILLVAVTGCARLNTAFRDFNVDDGSGAMVDIKQRAVIVSKQNSKTIVCAEPSPDAMAAYAAEVAGKLDIYGKVGAELAGAAQESAAFTGLRTQSIQLLRDGLYRLCEGYMSGALDTNKYDTLMRRYQRYMVALLGIEQLTGAIRVPPVVINTEGRAETAAALPKLRKEIEKIDLELMEKRKKVGEIEKNLEALHDKPDDDPGKKELNGEKETLKRQISEWETDKKRLEKGIENARGSIVSGSATANVNSTSTETPRADTHIQAVAQAVENIVMNILDTDDTGQLCWGYLLSKNDSKKDEIRAACIKHVNANTEMKMQILESNLAREKVFLDKFKNSQSEVDPSLIPGLSPSRPQYSNWGAVGMLPPDFSKGLQAQWYLPGDVEEAETVTPEKRASGQQDMHSPRDIKIEKFLQKPNEVKGEE